MAIGMIDSMAKSSKYNLHDKQLVYVYMNNDWMTYSIRRRSDTINVTRAFDEKSKNDR